MVAADGGGGDQLDFGAGEQRLVAVGSGTDEQHVGICGFGAVYILSGQVFNVKKRFEYTLDIGNGFVDDGFHIM